MKRALLLQLALPRLNPLEEKGNIPLGPAYLKAYAQSVPSVGGTWALDILPRREADFLCAEDVAKRVLQERPETVGFSLFLWNIEKSLAVVRRIHEERPETVFLFGGPEVTEENPLLAQEPLFQTGVIGEGERALSLLLKGVPPRGFPASSGGTVRGGLSPPGPFAL
ncbi:MAG: B12 binding domain protein [Candidatus Aminicenantes bacterium ADurb.Bin508]|nr:MAG: B12 binding domain protein [Candidatus Aminicenantes bacterium ADurb.Bin508]